MSLTLRLAVIVLGVLQLYQCAVPHGNQERTTYKHGARPPNTSSTHAINPKTPSVKPAMKIESPATSKPVQPVKPATPAKPHKKLTKAAPSRKAAQEFPLNEIFFKGRETNEANNFFKIDDRKGKPLEQVYEQAREQDLNEIEDALRRRLKYLY